MMNLATVLKLLGVKITPEQIAELEVIVPQIPARAAQVIQYVNASVHENQERLRAMDLKQDHMLRVLEFIQMEMKGLREMHAAQDDEVHYAGVGATQNLLELGELDSLPSTYDTKGSNNGR